MSNLGEVIDKYIDSILKPGQGISSLYLYMGDGQEPKVIINTAEDSYDYTEILFKLVDLHDQKLEAEKTVKALQDKVRQLEKSRRAVEKAIQLLTKASSSPKAQSKSNNKDTK